MLTRLPLLFAGAVTIVSTMISASAPAAAGPYAAAAACLRENVFEPARVVGVEPDGYGDYDVLVRDADGDLWLCNASPFGLVFSNDML